MAKLNDITPDFNWNQIERQLADFREYVIDQEVEKLRFIGEQFANKARNKQGEGQAYQDRTGNLRHSIGFAIIKNGEIIDLNLDQGHSEAHENARMLAGQFAGQYTEGLVLVGFAGMEYAAAVEAKGYDVITGSTPSIQELMSELMEI